MKVGKIKIFISGQRNHKIENEDVMRGAKGLNEKQMEIVEQYDVKVKDSFRSRGCLHLETDSGLWMITPYYGSPLRLACELELQKQLVEAGFLNIDKILPNREEGLISYDKYRTPFIVKRSFQGKECSLKDEKEVEAAGRNLGKLHRTLAELDHSYSVENRETPLIPCMLKSRKSELKRIRNYIKKSGRRTEFELVFTSCYEAFYEEAKEALCMAEEKDEEFFRCGYGICHGSYHQHNILMIENKEAATLNIGQFHYNQQILDLYGFMRKTLEKNNYHRRFFEAALAGYEKERRLEKEEYEILKILFSFPEKFWKISNQYYNSKKCWMPPKNLEKLKKTMEQNEKRKDFLKAVMGVL